MQVVLEQDVKGTGKKGEIVNVSDGYARNFLLPRKLASPADKAALNAMNIQKAPPSTAALPPAIRPGRMPKLSKNLP